MRISFPIAALMLLICASLTHIEWQSGTVLQPPLPGAQLAHIYQNAGARSSEAPPPPLPTTAPGAPTTAPSAIDQVSSQPADVLPRQPIPAPVHSVAAPN